MKEFDNFNDWAIHCRQQKGWDGPNRLAGQPPGWQFVSSDGTQAVWNANKNRGFVFEDESSPFASRIRT